MLQTRDLRDIWELRKWTEVDTGLLAETFGLKVRPGSGWVSGFVSIRETEAGETREKQFRGNRLFLVVNR